jgi:predicted NAD/FAD-binding protein
MNNELGAGPLGRPGRSDQAGRSGRFMGVIGAGVSGLTAAYLLTKAGHHVTLYEADNRLGGHADTHEVTGPDGRTHAVDTGFIVYNEHTYPLLTRLLAELGVPGQDSEMSMSVRCAGCGLQYAGHRGLRGLLPGLPTGRGRYARMLTEIPAFHRRARQLLDAGGQNDDVTLGQFLAAGGFSDYFRTHFALPLVAAVWSCPPDTALQYPARYLFEFLRNHGMLSVTGSPPWRTVTGGSRSYVRQIARRIPAVQTCAPARAVHRFPDGASVRDGSGRTTAFDAVVIATHADQALALLAHPTPVEEKVLGAFRYTSNPALLHTDRRLLPARPGVRASWNYELSACDGPEQRTRISYYINRLQQLSAEQDYIVTLGGDGAVAEPSIVDRMDYSHPAYTPDSVAAQRQLPELNTASAVFAGAYHGWGFHEDGCRSGVDAARALGATW